MKRSWRPGRTDELTHLLKRRAILQQLEC
jgi:hypothetical protein